MSDAPPDISAAQVRRATPGDSAAISDIYRPWVEDHWASFEQTAPDTGEIARRIAAAGEAYPWLAAVSPDGSILGYGYASPHRARASYRTSVDVAIYLAAAAQGQGLGRRLYATLLDLLTRQNFVTAFGGIALPNPASLALHRAMGFTEMARYTNVGFKHGCWRDTVWMQRPLATPQTPPAPLLPVPDIAETAP